MVALGITRKDFLRLALMGTAGLTAIPNLNAASAHKGGLDKSAVYHVRPLPGKIYTRSFLRFCEQSRFRSVKEALRQIKGRGVECQLCRI